MSAKMLNHFWVLGLILAPLYTGISSTQLAPQTHTMCMRTEPVCVNGSDSSRNLSFYVTF